MAATAPSGPQFCNQNDVELAIGGVAILAQLLDKNGDGIADADLVTAVIARASAETAAAVGNNTAIGTLTAPFPDALVYYTASIAQFYAWSYGSAEVIIPEGSKALHDDALRFLDQVARRERSLGVAAPPASVLQVKQIDTDPTSSRMTREGLKGFWTLLLWIVTYGALG